MRVITLARKPLLTVAANVLQYETGGLHVEACRIETNEDCSRKPAVVGNTAAPFAVGVAMGGLGSDAGRFPANVVLQGSASSDDLNEQSGEGFSYTHERIHQHAGGSFGGGRRDFSNTYADAGGASRFFKQVP